MLALYSIHLVVSTHSVTFYAAFVHATTEYRLAGEGVAFCRQFMAIEALSFLVWLLRTLSLFSVISLLHHLTLSLSYDLLYHSPDVHTDRSFSRKQCLETQRQRRCLLPAECHPGLGRPTIYRDGCSGYCYLPIPIPSSRCSNATSCNACINPVQSL